MPLKSGRNLRPFQGGESVKDCLRYLVASIHTEAETQAEHDARHRHVRRPNRGDPSVGY